MKFGFNSLNQIAKMLSKFFSVFQIALDRSQIKPHELTIFTRPQTQERTEPMKTTPLSFRPHARFPVLSSYIKRR
jgi:CRISPR/Cas system endoribonuclease Cas6 (RAMP superfamily)